MGNHHWPPGMILSMPLDEFLLALDQTAAFNSDQAAAMEKR